VELQSRLQTVWCDTLKIDTAKGVVNAMPDINLLTVHFNDPNAIITINMLMVLIVVAVVTLLCGLYHITGLAVVV